MAREQVTLSFTSPVTGLAVVRPLQIARERDGSKRWHSTLRASVPGDPSTQEVAEWRVDGPSFFSEEEVQGPGDRGYLGVDWAEQVETRLHRQAMLARKLFALTLSIYDQTHAATPSDGSTALDSDFFTDGAVAAANVTAFEVATGSAEWLYALRGQLPAKVSLSSASLNLAPPGIVLTEAATSILRSYTAEGQQELSIGMPNQPYVVAVSVQPATGADDWRVNTQEAVEAVIGLAPDAVVGHAARLVQRNFITSGTTMYDPNWIDFASIPGEAFSWMNFALSGDMWIPGTTNGPMLLDDNNGKFFFLIPELDNSPRGCSAMLSTSFELGVIYNHAHGVRWQRGSLGGSWGSETFPGNRAAWFGTGYHTAFAVNDRGEVFDAYYVPSTDKTYITCWRKPVDDPRHPEFLSPYVLYSFTGFCGAMKYVGTANGVRTYSTLFMAKNSDALYIIDEPPEFANVLPYTQDVELTGTLYLTTLRRDPDCTKDLEAIEFLSEDTGSGAVTYTATITVKIAPQGKVTSLSTLSGTLTRSDGSNVNGPVNTDTSPQWNRLLFVDDSLNPLSWAIGARFPKPVLVFTTNSTGFPPVVRGTVRLYYRNRPLLVEDVDVVVELPDNAVVDGKTLLQELQQLAGVGSGMDNTVAGAPVKITEDASGDAYWCRITAVDERVVQSRGGGNETPTDVRAAVVRLTKWPAGTRS